VLAKIVVHGRVQGVGFRYSVMHKALERGIRGWVRNNPDGTVSIEAEADESSLKQFIKDIQKGLNPFIRVTDLDIDFSDEEKGYKKFVVKY